MPYEFKAELIPDERKGKGVTNICVVVPANLALEMKHYDKKKSFYVKGHLDYVKYEMLPLAPVGDGTFLLRIPPALRKELNKIAGDTVSIRIQKDRKYYPMNFEFRQLIIEESRDAWFFYALLPPVHQHYFNKWIAEAKTEDERAERMLRTFEALKNKVRFTKMKKGK